MSELEREELTRRINGMSEEEKMLACSLMPSEILMTVVSAKLFFFRRENSKSGKRVAVGGIMDCVDTLFFMQHEEWLDEELGYEDMDVESEDK